MKNPAVQRAYLNYIPTYPIYKPPNPLVLIKCSITYLVPPVNLPSASSYLANLAFSKGEIVKISGMVARAPATPLLTGEPLD